MSLLDLSSRKKSNHRPRKSISIAYHEDPTSHFSTLSYSTVHHESVSKCAPLEPGGSMLSERLDELDSEDHHCSQHLERKRQHNDSGAHSCGPEEQGKADPRSRTASSKGSKTRDWAMIAVFTAVALGIRLWGISWPDEVG